MLEYLGWSEAANHIYTALEHAIESRHVTYDLERLMDGAVKCSTSEFADVIIQGL
jgi:isocitrate dehydrogenase